jgi:hypothetical protein
MVNVEATMTKLERAIKEAEQLPDEFREQLGDDLLHFIHKYLALRDELAVGISAITHSEKARSVAVALR